MHNDNQSYRKYQTLSQYRALQERVERLTHLRSITMALWWRSDVANPYCL
jgi:uncharacterized membrane protein (DUF485 family)